MFSFLCMSKLQESFHFQYWICDIMASGVLTYPSYENGKVSTVKFLHGAILWDSYPKILVEVFDFVCI